MLYLLKLIHYNICKYISIKTEDNFSGLTYLSDNASAFHFSVVLVNVIFPHTNNNNLTQLLTLNKKRLN